MLHWISIGLSGAGLALMMVEFRRHRRGARGAETAGGGSAAWRWGLALLGLGVLTSLMSS